MNNENRLIAMEIFNDFKADNDFDISVTSTNDMQPNMGYSKFVSALGEVYKAGIQAGICQERAGKHLRIRIAENVKRFVMNKRDLDTDDLEAISKALGTDPDTLLAKI